MVASTTTFGLAYGQRVIHVRQTATGLNDGSSWTDAYRDLQNALDDARAAGDTDAEIWIAEGTYKPDHETHDQTLAFELFGTIKLYGGFAGDEERRDQRDVKTHATILSGDLNDDDDLAVPTLSDCCDPRSPGTCSDAECHALVVALRPRCADRWQGIGCNWYAISRCCDLCRPTRCDNSFNVLRSTEPESAPTLDGLTIMAGEAHGAWESIAHTCGGGLYVHSSNPRVNGCVFRLNGGYDTAAVCSYSGTPVLEDTSLVENGIGYPSQAAAIYAPAAPLTFRRLTVERNSGGGLKLFDAVATLEESSIVDNRRTGLDCFTSDCTVVRSRFVSNDVGLEGGDVTRVIDSLFLTNRENGLVTWGLALVVNSVFAGNTGYFAAAFDAFSGSAYVANSIFVGNSANGVGGMWVGDGATILNSIFWGNSDAGGFSQPAQFTAITGTVINVSNSIVQGWTGSWGGVGNSGDDPLFLDADGPDGVAGTADDNLRLAPGSAGINAGSAITTFLPTNDLDGHPRILCGTVDLGPYEFGFGDYDCDRSVDLADFASWPVCMTGPQGDPYDAGCEAFDFDGDADTDLRDFHGLQRIVAP